MRQYFVTERLQLGNCVQLSREIAHHLKNVLRKKSGDMIRLVDSEGQPFLAELNVSDTVYATVSQQLEEKDKQGTITCCPCLIKRDKWEMLIQKAAELGADRIVPLISSRTIVHIDEKEIDRKLARWNKIALEACQQSNSTDVCTVTKPVYLVNIAEYMSENNLLAYENEENAQLLDLCDERDITIVTGPEGGFSSQEAEFLNGLGFVSCSLGQRILRAETAVLYALAVIDAKRNTL